MENNSGLIPKGRAVLVRHYDPKATIASSIIIPEHVQRNTAIADQRAVVVAIGPSAWLDEPSPRAEIGERVMISKYTGFIAVGPKDGAIYRIINDRDIFAGITDDGELANG